MLLKGKEYHSSPAPYYRTNKEEIKMLYQELRNGKRLKVMKYIKFKTKFKTESPT